MTWTTIAIYGAAWFLLIHEAYELTGKVDALGSEISFGLCVISMAAAMWLLTRRQ